MNGTNLYNKIWLLFVIYYRIQSSVWLQNLIFHCKGELKLKVLDWHKQKELIPTNGEYSYWSAKTLCSKTTSLYILSIAIFHLWVHVYSKKTHYFFCSFFLIFLSYLITSFRLLSSPIWVFETYLHPCSKLFL